MWNQIILTMKRSKVTTKRAGLMFTADWHLQEKQPICRLDNFLAAQWNKVDQVAAIQEEYDCDVIHAGDLFDHWKPSPDLLRQTLLHLPKQFYTIYGQHDLPQHNLKLVHKCGVNTLEAADRLGILGKEWLLKPTIDTSVVGVHWGEKPEDFYDDGGKKILIWHKLNYKHKPYLGCTDPSPLALLRKYPQFDIIVTGDNHETFTESYKGRWLINPGSLMRLDADQVNHRPCVIIWFPEDNSIKIRYLTIEKDVISREHIDQKKQRDGRIDAFISKLDEDWEAETSFEDNLEEFSKRNKVNPKVMEIVYKAIES